MLEEWRPLTLSERIFIPARISNLENEGKITNFQKILSDSLQHSGTSIIQTDLQCHNRRIDLENLQILPIFYLLAVKVNSCETLYYVLVDLPVYAMEAVTRFPLAPSPSHNQKFCCLYTKCTHKLLKQLYFSPLSLLWRMKVAVWNLCVSATCAPPIIF